MKIKLGAVIPTVQYGNLQPEFEIEDDNPVVAMAGLEELVQHIWDKYGEKPLIAKGNSKRIKCFVGGEIDYDAEAHTYTWNGETYLSGSQYAKRFERPFDAMKISDAMAKKWGVDAKEIRDMWELKRDISAGLGTAIHAALELYGKYNGLTDKIEKTTHLHDHPVVKKVVEGFYSKHKEVAEYEAMIVDHSKKRAGQVDRLVILGDKHCRVEDYKTNAELPADKLKVYWEQLNFYGGIMQADGWKVEPPVIHHWDGSWHTYTEGQ